MFLSVGWVVLTSVDESKRLNPTKSRIGYLAYCEVKKTWYSKKKMNGKKAKTKNGKKKNGKLKPQATILYIFLLNMDFSEDVFEVVIIYWWKERFAFLFP